jgi:hypothetical protein
MQLQNDFVVMDKEEFLTNSLKRGNCLSIKEHKTCKLEISDVRWNIYLIEQINNIDK